MGIVVGCSGFSIPASRYFKEFPYVEITETQISVPGTGTVKRWRREAASTFAFALLAPREIAQEAFKESKVTDGALAMLTGVATELRAETVVFVVPPELPSQKNTRAAASAFLAKAKKKFPRIVLDAAHWDPSEVEDICVAAKVLPARDPLAHGLSSAKVAYYRLPGPAGHKSRYEDHSMEKLAELAGSATHTEATYVFTNVDMTQDAKRLMRALSLG
jgi:uncharacterized protein YecE (DUF72 family)